MLSKGFSKHSFKHKLFFLFNLSSGPLGQEDPEGQVGYLTTQRWKSVNALL